MWNGNISGSFSPTNIEGMIILSPTLSSEELASYNLPVVGIEREDQYICSVNTDNYMGGMQAASLLKKSCCDILIHVNARMPETTPAFGRIQGVYGHLQGKQSPL